ncbi:MAG TPA: 4-hydroxy-tetrahydrodipicolinate reductase [Burkholderiales bacterium]|jgi:4-hydroxy-tetrahydrodipicolinate reductase|nr:4-hydroxy-tetrahydrodipicolinate reductase [Burkholderiales bacterium]
MKVAVAGSGGRMGRTLVELILGSGDLALSGALEAAGHPALGRDAAAGVRITADAAAALKGAGCLIDFTTPEATLAHLEACVGAKVPMVIGTTGLSGPERKRVAAAAERIAIVFAPNMAVGVNVLFKLAETAAKALGEAYDVEIIEAHHRHKVDAPSGTAIRIGEIVATALGRDLASSAAHGRRGNTGEREAKTIGFHAVRGGDIVGEHTVMFAGEGERVELVVRSTSRATYAVGALRACRFLEGRAPGLYDMQDVLGLR